MASKDVAEQSKSENKDIRRLDVNWPPKELEEYDQQEERVKEEERIRRECKLNSSLERMTVVAVDLDKPLVSVYESVLDYIRRFIKNININEVIDSEQMGEQEEDVCDKSSICLWFLVEESLQNEQLIYEIKRIKLTTPILPILLKKCDIPEHFTEMEFLDVSKAKPEDVPFMVVRALLQYDHLKLQWIMQGFEDEPDLKKIMQDDVVFGPVFSDLLTNGGRKSVDLLTNSFNWIEKLRVCLKYTHEDDRILDDVEKSLLNKQEPFKMSQSEPKKTTKDLHYCIVKNDQIGILELLQNTKYPDKVQLEDVFEKFGRKHLLTKFAYMRLCKFIKKSNKTVVDVWPAYTMKAKRTDVQEGDIRLVIESKEIEQIFIENIHVKTIQILRKTTEQKSEHRDVIDYAYDRGIRLTGKDISQIGKVINKNISRLRMKHSNLLMIAASPIKSTGYTTGNHEKKEVKCVVLFVRSKGLIPLHEDCFPNKLGDFKTDVREGDCDLAVGGSPQTRHGDLKMGCEIGIFNGQQCGTLGGFMNNSDNKLYASTCCHVTHQINKTGVKRACVQPMGTNASNIFGCTVKTCYDGTKGVDATLIEISTSDRIPSGGFFPDCTSKELKLAGITDKELVYTSGRIESIDETNFDTYQDMILIKYGAASTLKRGRLAAFDMPTWISETLSVIFFHQIEINDIRGHGKFAEKGDSGSFVFLKTINGLVAIGHIMSTSDAGVTYVNPISNVINALDCTPYEHFQSPNNSCVTKANVERDNNDRNTARGSKHNKSGAHDSIPKTKEENTKHVQ